MYVAYLQANWSPRERAVSPSTEDATRYEVCNKLLYNHSTSAWSLIQARPVNRVHIAVLVVCA